MENCCAQCGKPLTGRQKIFCSNECKLSNKDNILLRTRPREIKNDSSKLIRCKIDGRSFKDIYNYSGVLTRHLQKLNLDGNIEDYFEIIDNPKKDIPSYQCKYCTWKTKDIENKSGCITSHLSNKHNKKPSEHIIKYPDDSHIWNYTHSKELREHFLSQNDKSFIECRECNMKMRRITISHLKLHGMTPEQYKFKYNLNILICEELTEFSKESYQRNFNAINKEIKRSKAEVEIREFLSQNGIFSQIGRRNLIHPFELDLYIPEYNIAIEYNGLYWHSELSGGRTRDFHLDKLNRCEEKGIHLIQIFEDEWNEKRDLIKRRLLHLFNKSIKISARKCEIRQVTSKEKSEFLIGYHVQGNDKAIHSIGLYYKDELQAIMSFSELRNALGHRKSEGVYELSRYASKDAIIGGASKLMKYFINTYKPVKIISYADRRWTCINKNTLYEKIGFKRVSVTKPNYWYTKGYHKRLHRFNFTKKRIVEEFAGDPLKTELENMIILGYDRIWDCGHIKYEMEIIPYI